MGVGSTMGRQEQKEADLSKGEGGKAWDQVPSPEHPESWQPLTRSPSRMPGWLGDWVRMRPDIQMAVEM